VGYYTINLIAFSRKPARQDSSRLLEGASLIEVRESETNGKPQDRGAFQTSCFAFLPRASPVGC
jgi:hypothetical protein